MRIHKQATALLLAALFISGAAYSEGFDPTAPAVTDKRTERAADLMSSQLGLTDDQQAAVRSALETQTEKLNQLDQQIAERDKAIHDEADTAILKVLTPSQRKKYPAVKEKLENDAPPVQNHRMSLSKARPKRKPASF